MMYSLLKIGVIILLLSCNKKITKKKNSTNTTPFGRVYIWDSIKQKFVPYIQIKTCGQAITVGGKITDLEK